MLRMITRPDRGHSGTARLWAASALSSGSTWVMQISLFIQVLQDSSPATLAAVELIGTVPALAFMMVAGTLADRFDVRRLAVGSMVAQAVCVLGMALFLDHGIWITAAFYGLQGLGNTLWPPARQQWLYGVVAPESRPAANARLGSVSGTMTVVGASLGGALAGWSPAGAMAVACGLQVLAVVPLLVQARRPMPYAEPAAAGAAAREAPAPLRKELTAGLRVLRDLPLARSVVWIGIAWGCIGGAYDILLAAYATGHLGGGGAVLGSLYVADGVAVILGTVLAARFAVRRHLAAYTAAYVVQGLAWGAFFLAGHPVLAVALLGVMRLASGVVIALDTTVLLATVPAAVRGRVSSLHMTTYGAMARVSLALFGGLLTVCDVRTVGVCTGAASVVLGILWWRLRDREAQRAYPTAVAAREPAAAAA
ncbi:MFS transporter [Streptomyces sp. ZAF1911]|uniref:MFS transporter n=1 Tax=Streptomyces sp. ZAF1911 TaxID=2944129 RepID=UPI00237B9DFD|nr:MFS transporter [Streptomyces sp. ZAF1911]MDD9378519.1 MFS transporter [Streptomyces sp. ZAF1911]